MIWTFKPHINISTFRGDYFLDKKIFIHTKRLRRSLDQLFIFPQKIFVKIYYNN